MTLKKFVELAPEEIDAHFQMMRVTFAGVQIVVAVEKSLIPQEASPQEVEQWVITNAQVAIDTHADGRAREGGGKLHGVWRWVRRIVHERGSVTILDATAES